MSATRTNQVVAWCLAGLGARCGGERRLRPVRPLFLVRRGIACLQLLRPHAAGGGLRLRRGADRRTRAPVPPVSTVAAIGLVLGALWEIVEFCYDHFIAKPNAILAKIDTVIDMSLDTLGALAAGLVLLRMLGR